MPPLPDSRGAWLGQGRGRAQFTGDGLSRACDQQSWEDEMEPEELPGLEMGFWNNLHTSKRFGGSP